jgi:DNA-binding NtrC family response regulator
MDETPNPNRPIIIVDDEEQILLAIDTTLRLAGMDNIVSCHDSKQVLSLLRKTPPEVLLLDLTMPNVGGEELLSLVNFEFPDIPVIVVTGSVDVETAVRCMKSGAFDYVVKPVDEGRLLAAVSRGMAFRELKRENLALKQHILSDTLEKPEAFSEIVTSDKKMFSIFQYAESIAQTFQPVLITGETGTGKELVSKAIHYASGRRGKFVGVNVAGLDDNVFSDTLFGHLRGAFTGANEARSGLVEKAAGGTLMLDEIGDLTTESQVKLLRFLQDGEYFPLGQDEPRQTQVRVIAATNKDPSELRQNRKFRKDLYFRLQTHHIHIPPLRERTDDIPGLVAHFLERSAKALNKRRPAVPRELFTLLASYPYPGNIRELEAMVFDAMTRHGSGILSMGAFKSHILKEAGDRFKLSEPFQEKVDEIVFPKHLPTIKQVTRLLVAEAIKRANGNQSIAASMIGVSQQAMSKRLKMERERLAEKQTQ